MPVQAGSFRLDLPQVEPRAGTAIVILVDTSGSMSQPAPATTGGAARPKQQLAREALQRIINHTAEWKKNHPERTVELAIYTFSSMAQEVLPMGPFDQGKAQAALARVPRASGGTAIGQAVAEGFKALYRSGCARKFVVCITDGENTSGPGPDWVARGLFAQTKGEVELQFVAFDTSARVFEFLKEVNGDVVEAGNGEQLQAELTKIYEQRILVEKEDVPPKN
jgi:Mg-chelatase subunit ChlD